MPELPEVETTLRGVAPHVVGKKIQQVVVRQGKLRWQVDERLPDILLNQKVLSCSRRAKYLIVECETGVVLIHLGMSGSLCVFECADFAPPHDKHDHIEWLFEDGTLLRYHDPRRFGAVLWFAGAPENHVLLSKLAPEPLGDEFTGQYLHRALQKVSRPIKLAIMDNALVVGVGNIYANESLFYAGILPMRLAKDLTADECRQLVFEIKTVLQRAIDKGGSSLRDFVNSDGKSGYFQQEYAVYGRAGEACKQCGAPILKIHLGQRGTFYCEVCQR